MSTRKDFEDFMARVGETTGRKDLVPDGDIVRVTFAEGLTICVHHEYVSSTFLLFATVAVIPPGSGERVFREVLTGSLFGRETAGGSFALEPHANTLIYQRWIPFDPARLEPADFIRNLERTVSLLLLWRDAVSRILAADAQVESDSAHEALLRV